MVQLLDQFCEGLKKAGVLDIVRAYPDQFLTLFVYKELTPEDVLSAVCVPVEQGNGDETVMSYFNQFICESDEAGKVLCLCMISTTYNNS